MFILKSFKMNNSNFEQRISCKLKLVRVLSLVVLCHISMLTPVHGTEKKEEHISIVIGGNGIDSSHISNSNRLIGLYEDEGGSGNSSSGSLVYESASWNMCRADSRTKCCYQYTWPGFISKIPEDPRNATCEYLRQERKDDSFPCFDPLVYTLPAEGHVDPIGTPPDFNQLVTKSKNNKWNIYCPMTDKSCIKITHYARSGNGRISNHTMFCGVVTNSNNGEQMQDGCYRQKVDGYTREVCVCSGHLCNSPATALTTSTFALIVTIVVSLACRNCHHLLDFN